MLNDYNNMKVCYEPLPKMMDSIITVGMTFLPAIEVT